MNNICYYNSPIGVVFRIEDDGSYLKAVDFLKEGEVPLEKEISPLGEKTKSELDEYFEGKRKTFDLPLKPEGTPFQEKVWKALYDIPYGMTKSYKEVAEASGCPRGYRAVGNANNKNPICIIIPCHRCIAAGGHLGGYGGGTDVKMKLLDLEGAIYKKG